MWVGGGKLIWEMLESRMSGNIEVTALSSTGSREESLGENGAVDYS